MRMQGYGRRGSFADRCFGPSLSRRTTDTSPLLYGERSAWAARSSRATLQELSEAVLYAIMFDVILYQPEIPPNTGNIIRLCANTGVRLHLVKPLGFTLADKQLMRAGLDYHEFATIAVHETWAACLEHFTDRRIFAVSTKGEERYDLTQYVFGDVFMFGPETRGLPAEVLKCFPEKRRIRLPMLPESRSLNLSNAVAIVVYEALRQSGFNSCR